MKCSQCGEICGNNTTRCCHCGGVLEPYILRITPEEAKHGCKKRLCAPFMANTLVIPFHPGVKNGTVYLVHNAEIICTQQKTNIEDIYVKVLVEKKRAGHYAAKKKAARWPWMMLLFLVLFFCAFLYFGGFWAPDPTQETSTQVSSTLPPESDNTNPSEMYDPLFEIPHFKNRVLLAQLDDRLLSAFYAMYDSVMLFESDCDIPVSISEDELSLLLSMLHLECPELMQVNFFDDLTCFTDKQTGNIQSIKWNYCMDSAEYQEKYNQCQEIVNALIATTANMPVSDQQKIVYDYIVNFCTYALEGEDVSNAYGAIVSGRAKCDGISLAFKWIMEDMGFSCFCLYGEPISGGISHAWNVVEIDGHFLDIDVTADVRADESSFPNLYPAYNVSDQWIRDGYKLNPVYDYFASIPGTDSMEFSYHSLENTFVAGGTSPEEIFERQFFLACDGRGYLAIQFENRQDMEAFADRLEETINREATAQGFYNVNWECYTLNEYRILYLKCENN